MDSADVDHLCKILRKAIKTAAITVEVIENSFADCIDAPLNRSLAAPLKGATHKNNLRQSGNETVSVPAWKQFYERHDADIDPEARRP
jgi:hypothetical protein